jgi:L-arabinokinase
LASVFFYISGHGFGHASRQIEIVNALGTVSPGLDIVVRSSVPAWLFERTVRVPVQLVPGDCDTGVVQIDSLRLDARATILRAAAFHARLPALAAIEAEALRAHDARLVVSDAPPLACVAASTAGVPSVVVSNFTWDWIYEGYEDELVEAPALVPQIQSAYRCATAAWRLPLHGGFETFHDREVVDVPFVARHARHGRDVVRRRFGLAADRPLVLFSFGGLGVRDVDFDRLDCLDRYDVVLTSYEVPGVTAAGRHGVHVITEAQLYGSGFRYEDLVAAADIVLTKPGYGIIAECLANGAGILYTSRGRFREYDVLVDAMPRFLRCGYVDHDALFGGRWRAALDQVLSQPMPQARPATNGAGAIAGMILQHV